MAGALRKAMIWLGLAPDEEYEEYGYDEPARPAAGARRPGPAPGRSAGMPDAALGGHGAEPGPYDGPSARPVPRPRAGVRPVTARGLAGGGPPDSDVPTVRPVRSTSAQPQVVTPVSFDDAKQVGDRFKAGKPVVIDLTGLDRELSRRLIDFSSGVCFSLDGAMERLRPGVYLLSPVGVNVSTEERRRLAES